MPYLLFLRQKANFEIAVGGALCVKLVYAMVIYVSWSSVDTS